MSYSITTDSRTLSDRIMKVYARWRIRPTKQESRAYNSTNSILLTFDDFTDEARVKDFLAILAKENVKAAFFLLGEWALQNAEVIQKIKDEGHWVGNHTYSHQNLRKLSSKEACLEIGNGVMGKLLRPPFGVYNNRVRKDAEQMGYRIAFWSIDSDDWRGISPTEIQNRVINQLHPGACILLHLNGRHTLDALPGLIKGIRERGFELCSEGTEISL